MTDNPHNYNSMSESLPTTDPSAKSSSRLDVCFAASACGAGLSLLVVALAWAAFFVSGIVFTVQEFDNVPSCAAPYKAWMVTILVLMGCSSRAKDARDQYEKSSELAYALIASSIVIGAVGALGWALVLDYPAKTCDTSDISKLTTWTEWFVYYCVSVSAAAMIIGIAVLRAK